MLWLGAVDPAKAQAARSGGPPLASTHSSTFAPDRERTLRTDRYKVVERPSHDGGWRVELYDLAADPAERRDLAEEQPELASRLRAELDAVFAEVEPPPARELEPEELAALRALGYVR